MKRTTLLAVGFLASLALLVSTGAYPLSTGSDEVADGDIVMSPTDGPNGKYAVMNSDDEIELMLTDQNPDIEGDGVNDDALTPIDRVFSITYTGDESARVWITDDATDVEFYRNDNPDDSLESQNESVVLGPNETVAIGLLVDTRRNNDVENISEFSVNAKLADSSGGGGGGGGGDDDGGSDDDNDPLPDPDDGSDDNATNGTLPEDGDNETVPDDDDNETVPDDDTGNVTIPDGGDNETQPNVTDGNLTEGTSGEDEGIFEFGGIAVPAWVLIPLLLIVALLAVAMARQRM